MDSGKLSLVIGITALVLAVPLAIFANILTPKITEWYSRSSRQRAQRRIAELEKIVASELPLMEFEDLLLFNVGIKVYKFVALGLYAIGILCYGLITALRGPFLQSTSSHHPIAAYWVFSGFALATSLFGYFNWLIGRAWHRRIKRTRTQIGRLRVKREIDALRSQFAEPGIKTTVVRS